MPDEETVRHTPPRAIVGRNGLPAVMRGYTEIDCGGSTLRIHADHVVVGSRGQPVIRRGETEIVEGSNRRGPP